MHSVSRRRNKGRWGNKYVDNRDWVKYNEELVVRGEFLLDMSMFDNWEKELEEMNKGKRGRPFKFPASFIQWQAVWHQWLDYRGLEGVARSLSAIGLIPGYDDYTTAWKRIHCMKPQIMLPSDVEAASDGTGMRTGNAGEYRAYRYGTVGRKRRYVVVVITADVGRRKLLAVDAHIEGKGKSEHSIVRRQLRRLTLKGKRVTKFYGDGAYDTNDMFDALGDASSAIKIRSNASTDYYRGSKRRRREIREYHRLGYGRWAEQTCYGMRWVATEGMFSTAKRKFGENLMATSRRGLTAEAMQRMWAYDTIKCYGESRMAAMM